VVPLHAFRNESDGTRVRKRLLAVVITEETVKTTTVVFLAMMFGALPLSAASAMTVAGQNGIAATAAPLHLIDYRKPGKRAFHHKRRHSFTPGGRYNSAPRHWHRYHTRPGNWRTRGCIIVGPVWWCP
jgi:hypothetical protein